MPICRLDHSTWVAKKHFLKKLNGRIEHIIKFGPIYIIKRQI
jgi:hypothetical protein